jgi:CBS domain-containing protein
VILVQDVLKAKGRRVISIGPESSVKQAMARFVKHNIGSLPVVSPTGQVIGIFSERDAVFGGYRDSERFHQRLIGEVMTRDPIICGPRDTLAAVMGKMARHHVGQLPVVDGGELVGLVSIGDLVESLYEQVESENLHLMNFLHGRP